MTRSLIGIPLTLPPAAGSRPPARFQRPAAERLVDLAPQVADVDIDDVGARVVGEIPGVLEQVQPREDLAGPPHERLEQRELLGRERDLVAAATDLPGRRVEHQITNAQGGRALGLPAPYQRPQARKQLREGERLHQVVVGTGVEPRDAVLDGVAGRQHQDGCPDTGVTQSPARLEAVDARQHHVEHDRVVLVGLGHPEGVLAGRRDVRSQTLGDEPAANQARHPQFVLHYEHAHVTNAARSRMNAR